MRQKPLAFLLLISSLVISGCGQEGADSSSDAKWVGETGSGSAAVHMEFGSYDECIAGMQSEAASGVFNCGVQ